MIFLIWILVARASAATCAEMVERLGQTDEIAAHLTRHRDRVIANLGAELYPIDTATRESRLDEVLLRAHDPAFFDWMDAHGNGATVFHGAGSPSLVAFLPHGSLGLLPNHVLMLDLGLTPLTGWCDSVGEDPMILNNIGMNVVRAAQFQETDHYRELHGRWTRQGCLNQLADGYLPDEYTANIYRRRLELLEGVPKQWRWFISEPFPVVYGFTLRDDALLWLPFRDGPHTIVASNLSPAELRVVFVPGAKVLEVRRLLGGLNVSHEVAVVPLEDLSEAERRTFWSAPHRAHSYSRVDLQGTDAEFEAWLATLGRR